MTQIDDLIKTLTTLRDEGQTDVQQISANEVSESDHLAVKQDDGSYEFVDIAWIDWKPGVAQYFIHTATGLGCFLVGEYDLVEIERRIP